MNLSIFQSFNKSNGFTLIELLITIAIISVVFVIGMINVVSYRQRQSLNSTAQEIVAVLRNAQDRSLAQESGSIWGSHFVNAVSPERDYYELFFGPSYASSTIVSKIVLPSTIQFELPTTSSTVIFSAVTGLPNASTTIKISLINTPSVSSTIIVNPNGEIQY